MTFKRGRRRAAPALFAALLSALLVGLNAAPASASGYAVTPGPNGCLNQSKWVTSSVTGTYETLYVATVGQCLGKTNSCNYGLSVWYNDPSGVRRNSYQVFNSCTWGPYWWMSTPYFSARRGTTVQITVRFDGNWYNATTFRIN